MPRTFAFDPRAVSSYAATHGETAAMNHFGCSKATVRNACKQFGVTLHSEAKAIKRERDRLIIECLEKGEDPNLICARHQITLSTLRHLCYRYRIANPFKKRSIAFSSSSFEVLRMLWEGASDADIGKALFISRERVRQIRNGAIAAKLFGPSSFLQMKQLQPPENSEPIRSLKQGSYVSIVLPDLGTKSYLVNVISVGAKRNMGYCEELDRLISFEYADIV